jgi:hypothetical protein
MCIISVIVIMNAVDLVFPELASVARRLVLIEACARVLKNKLNIALQKKMKEVSMSIASNECR